ncbi:MAG: ASKHA domain-containing protein [Clostridiales Family XIII bacterium]|jgi:uncharacterized 2Fe-2S/4Fe-4S cluster protein (DUF4445 family)|nr:ASKHA domain-containing protein [Clostridiales Family XIII bacterium]
MKNRNDAMRSIDILPSDLEMDLQGSRSLLDLIREAGEKVESPCNGMGTCGKCKVRILAGTASRPGQKETSLLSADELKAGIRLACYTYPETPIKVEIASDSERGHKIQSEGVRLDGDRISGRSFVEKILLHLEKPSLQDNRSDAERVETAAGYTFSPLFLPEAIAQLPQVLASGGGTVTAVIIRNKIIAVEAGDTTARVFGAAVDIGTTTVVVSIIDVTAGKEIGSAAAANDQRDYGQDVLSRIRYTTEEAGGGEKLHRIITAQITDLIREAATAAGVTQTEIYGITIAANTSMLHLLLNIPGDSITLSPFHAAFTALPPFAAKHIGFTDFPQAILAILPSVSSYVGGDIVSGVLATGMSHSPEKVMLIDIGTNGEIIFGNDEGFSACSCAAGPALEGMNISCGVLAAEGAIESVLIEDGAVKIETIGGADATGICGSGIVDAIAALVNSGVITPAGRFAKPSDFETDERLRPLAERFKTDGEKRFVLSGGDVSGKEIYISQKDVRQVQLAKAAIASAIEVLMLEMNIESSDIDKVYIAGGFGKHLKLENLIRIGLIPAAFADKVSFVGNTSKSGAELALLSADALSEGKAVCAATRYFELSVYEGYEKLFVKEMGFPDEEALT